MAGRLSLITQVGSLSIPGDLFNDIERTTCATCEHSTVLKLSLSYEYIVASSSTSSYNFWDFSLLDPLCTRVLLA